MKFKELVQEVQNRVEVPIVFVNRQLGTSKIIPVYIRRSRLRCHLASPEKHLLKEDLYIKSNPIPEIVTKGPELKYYTPFLSPDRAFSCPASDRLRADGSYHDSPLNCFLREASRHPWRTGRDIFVSTPCEANQSKTEAARSLSYVVTVFFRTCIVGMHHHQHPVHVGILKISFQRSKA